MRHKCYNYFSKFDKKIEPLQGSQHFSNQLAVKDPHKPYSPLQPDGTQVFHSPVITIVKNMRRRMLIQDTDAGKELIREKEELMELVSAYRTGTMKQKSPDAR